MNKQAPILAPTVAICILKNRFGVNNAEKIYRAWRKEYMKVDTQR
ncbi:hypothetical protein [Clostridium niameyense]|nr:hypothetical protein [Clostridium niameyense]